MAGTPEPLVVQDHQARMRQAQQRALWELGDPVWADMIVSAFLDPEADRVALEREQAE